MIGKLTGSLMDGVVRAASARARSTRSRGTMMRMRVVLSDTPSALGDTYIRYI
jgi:hypothetical protein